MNANTLSTMLQEAADPDALRRMHRHLKPLRGVRGVPDGKLAQLCGEAWETEPAVLPRDTDALKELFSAAYEDGVVAIGLCAATVPDNPAAALDLGLAWCDLVDDVQTADQLGWVLLGPAALACDTFEGMRKELRQHRHPTARRAGVMATLAAMPAPIQGAAAAALRQRLSSPQVQVVDHPLDGLIAASTQHWLRDDVPMVRKALRRVLAIWGAESPDACEEWLTTVPSVPKMLRPDAEKAIKKARRVRQT